MTREQVISVLNRMQEQDRAKELPLTEEEWVAIYSATRHLNDDIQQPQGLDEAAEEYTKVHFTMFPDGSTDRGTRQMAFKAGAKWMSEQGETVEGEIMCAVTHPHENKVVARIYGDYKFGDKVIVQIRKKHE